MKDQIPQTIKNFHLRDINLSDDFPSEFIKICWENRLFPSSLSNMAKCGGVTLETVISDLQVRFSVARAKQEIDQDLLSLISHLVDWLTCDSDVDESSARVIFETYLSELILLDEIGMDNILFRTQVQNHIETFLWMVSNPIFKTISKIVDDNIPRLMMLTFAGEHKDFDLLYTSMHYHNYSLASKILRYGATANKNYSYKYLLNIASKHWLSIRFLHAAGVLTPILKHPENLAMLDNYLASRISGHENVSSSINDVGLINFIVNMFKPLLLDALQAQDEDILWQLNEMILRQSRILAAQQYSNFDRTLLDNITSKTTFTTIAPTLNDCIPAIRLHNILWSDLIFDETGNVLDIELRYSLPESAPHQRLFFDYMDPFCSQLFTNIKHINADDCNSDIKESCYRKISESLSCVRKYLAIINGRVRELGFTPMSKNLSLVTLLDLLIEQSDPSEVQQRLVKYDPLIQEIVKIKKLTIAKSADII